MKKIHSSILITIIYAIFTLFLVFHHEIWRDEAQVWMILKYSNIPELFTRLINEGHPPLFYLLIMPFVKLKLPVFSMQLVCWLFSVCGVFLLMQFSPFKWWVNISIVLSAGFIYDFPIIARSYSILPFLIFLCAILYSKNREHPIIYSVILLFISQTHALMLGFVSILTFMFLLDMIKNKTWTKSSLVALMIATSGILLTLIRSIQTIGNNSFIEPQSLNETSVLYQIFGILYQFFGTALGGYGFLLNLIVYFILFCSLFVLLYLLSKKSFAIATLAIAFQFYIYLNYYPGVLFINRVFSAYLILIFAYWISVKQNNNEQGLIKISYILLSLFFLMTTQNGFSMCVKDYLYNYSSGQDSAKYIINNIEEDAILLTDTIPMTESICLYLPEKYKVYHVNTDKEVKYVVWKNDILHRFELDEWNKYISSHNFSGKKIYIIQSLNQALYFKNGKIKYISPKSLTKFEDFIIQEYNYDNK